MLAPQPPATLSGGNGLATITHAQLAGLSPAELLARATSPTVRMMGVASFAGRKEVVRRLDAPNSAVFGYWILFIHGRRALTGFCAELPHRTVDPDFWTLLDLSLSELDDREMLAVTRRFRAEIERAQTALAATESRAVEREWDWERTAAMLALLDPRTMRQLDEDYRRADPGSLDLVAAYIRGHANQIFNVTDESKDSA
jgi:hypothetical protein